MTLHKLYLISLPLGEGGGGEVGFLRRLLGDLETKHGGDEGSSVGLGRGISLALSPWDV